MNGVDDGKDIIEMIHIRRTIQSIIFIDTKLRSVNALSEDFWCPLVELYDPRGGS